MAVLAGLEPALAALLGAIWGSFAATLVLRWPAGRGLGGRSACDACGAGLRWFELVPLLSALVQRGRCHHCGAAIAPLHWRVEAAAAGLGAAAVLLVPGGVSGWALAALIWLLLPLALLDWRHYWLPDPLVALVAAAGLALGGEVMGTPLVPRIAGAALLGAGLGLIAAVYRRVRGRDGMGGGDPKLAAAIALWLDPAALPLLILLASLIGIGWAAARRDAAAAIPFGTCLAAAAITVPLLWPLLLRLAV